MTVADKIDHIINIEFKNKIALPSTYENPINKAILAVLKNEKADLPCTINVLITGDEEIREFNRDYRNINKATDVLSFPMQNFSGFGWEQMVSPEPDLETNYIPLGDIVVSMETVIRQAAEYKNSPEYELIYLIIHSTLHLLGYDHDSEENEKIMHDKNKTIAEKLNKGT